MKYLSLFLMFHLVIVQAQTLDMIDSLVKVQMAEREIPGLSVAVIRKGQVIHKNVYGYSVVAHQVKTRMETSYELASLTKQFVATGILLLVQDRKLDLDQPIEQYIDSLPPQWQKLTLRQLLSHTAGLAPQGYEYASLRPWPKYASKAMMWNAAKADTTYGEPGVSFRYHNHGYFLAVLIIEQVTGMPYKTFFQTRVFDPLHMDRSYFEDQVKIIPHEAQGYTIKDGELINIWRVSQEEMAGGWGIYSTVDDLIKWSTALDQHKLLRPEIQEEMFTPVRLNDGSRFRYGLGWFIPTRNEKAYYYHNGQTGPEILTIPEAQLTVIVLSNLGIGLGRVASTEADPYGVADQIASLLIPAFTFAPVVVPIDERSLRSYEGVFRFTYDDHVSFTVKNGQLYIRDKYGFDPMVHLGDGTFTFDSTPPVYYHFKDSDTIILTEDTWEDDWGKRKK